MTDLPPGVSHPAAPDLLVLEPAPRGHGREWMVHLARHARLCDPVPRLAFAVAPPVAERLRAELADIQGPRPAIIELSEQEVAACTHRRLAISGLARWWTMRRRLAATGARHGLFLEFDHLSLPLALGLPMGGGREVSGILFRPSVHYDRGTAATLSERIRDLRKEVLYRLMLRQGAVRQVHTLDEGFPRFARERYRGGGKVTALVDPAFPLIDPEPGDAALAGLAPAGRRLFVLFGVLSERKGVLALLQALAELDAADAAGIAVLIAGEVETAIRPAVEAAAADLAHRQPRLWLHLEPRFLRTGEIAALIDRADVVLAPYQRFVGSSGVLMWAASRGRPVIAQDYGLVGRLVREHRLGLTVDTADPSALAAAMVVAAGHTAAGLADPSHMAAFAARATPAAFAAAVLDPVLPDVRRRRAAARRPGAESGTESGAESGALPGGPGRGARPAGAVTD